MNKLLEWHFAQ